MKFAYILLFISLGCVDCVPRVKQLPRHVAKEVPSQFVTIGGIEYYFSNQTSVSWADSKIECENMNMTLINIETDAENTAIFDYLKNNPDIDLWRWTSGQRAINALETEWMWTGSNQPFTFTDWITGQPSNPNDVEDCVSFAGFIDGWDDDVCADWLMSFVCEEAMAAP